MSTLTNARIEALRLVQDGLVFYSWPAGPARGTFRVRDDAGASPRAFSWLRSTGYITLGDNLNQRQTAVVLTDLGEEVLRNYPQ